MSYLQIIQNSPYFYAVRTACFWFHAICYKKFVKERFEEKPAGEIGSLNFTAYPTQFQDYS
jgi:hypothetical protein